jgi:protein-L-isoaspartate(D-aspartate) O-methyltransferase
MTEDRKQLRNQMVAEQIEARDIAEARVLDALREIRRHEFVDAALVAQAYDDRPLPIGFGQTISQPYIVARMTELLAIEPQQRVLEIGAGCGYQTAILCKLARHVYAIERVPELCSLARENLRRAGCSNFTLRNGDGALGWPGNAPFERVLVAACAAEIPGALLAQLAPNGRLIAPIGGREFQDLTLAVKDTVGRISYSAHGAVSFVPLIANSPPSAASG